MSHSSVLEASRTLQDDHDMPSALPGETVIEKAEADTNLIVYAGNDSEVEHSVSQLSAVLAVEELPQTDAVQNDSLLFSRRKFQNHFRAYTFCSIFASVSSFCFGFDTGSIGPIISMHQFTNGFKNVGSSPTIQGLIVSSILITASLSSVAAGPLSDRFSRTYTFALGGIIFCLGSILAATASSLAMLFVGRSIAGVGEGLFMSTVTVYVLEIAPTSVRGRLSCTSQLFVTIGLACGYFVAYGTVRIESSLSWRLLFILQSIVSGGFAAGALLLPHSPRWLTHVGRDADAAHAWEHLGYTAAEVEKELEVQQRAERVEAAASRVPRGKSTMQTLFSKDVRQRTFLGVFLMAMQQACGIDGVLYYAPVLFKQAGLSSTQAAFLASGVSGLLNVACTVVTQIFTDNWGRRPSMIRGGSVIAGCMLCIGSLYASGATAHAVGRWAVIALIYVFIIAFAMSWAVVNRIYCSEIQPMQTRAAATSLGQCANWVVNWIIAFSTPLFLAHSSSGPYFLFGACALLTVLVCALFQPESRGLSLEALDSVFEVSPWRRMQSRARHAASRLRAGAADVQIAMRVVGAMDV